MNNDLISREALKEIILKEYKGYEVSSTSASDIIKIIDNAPTVDTFTFDDMKKGINVGYKAGRLSEKWERPQGKDNTPTGTWIPEEETYTDLSGTIETYTRFKCDNCMQGQNFGPYPFCPWCGKKMNPEIRKETKDEDVN